jgi:hypothetical protein
MMPQLDDISLAIGKIQATLEYNTLQIENLTRHVNHEIELLEARIAGDEERLEQIELKQTHDEVKSGVRWKMISAIGGGLASFIGLVVLFFSGALNKWFN